MFTALQKVRAVVEVAHQSTESTDGERAVQSSAEGLSSCINILKTAYVDHFHEAFHSGSSEILLNKQYVKERADLVMTHFQNNATQLGRNALGLMLEHSMEELEWQTCQEIFEGCAVLARKQKEEANARASKTEKQIKRARKVDF